ncbi:putative Sperm-associated antigen 7-like protein [Naja naja]|nr:putative Sperm-associated antigen 7-like protein [Naja naja]
MADLLGSILSAMEPPPGLDDREARRARGGHDVAEVAGLAAFSFGDENARYFTPCDELKAYRRGEEWDPRQAEEQRRMKVRGVVPVANKRDTRSIEEAINEIRAKKRLRQSEEAKT